MAGIFHPRVKSSSGHHGNFPATDLSVKGEHTGEQTAYVGWLRERTSVAPSRAPSSQSNWSQGISGRPTSVASTVDPDNEPIADVLSRLGDYTHNFTVDQTWACTDCECKNVGQQLSQPNTTVYSSDEKEQEDSDSDDDDDEGMKMAILLKMLQQMVDKGSSVGKQKAMMTLVNSYTQEECLSKEQLSQMIDLLSVNQAVTQEACLSLLKQCAKVSENMRRLLDLKLLNELHTNLSMSQTTSLCRPSLLLLEEVFLNIELKGQWLELATTKFLPLLLFIIRGTMTLDIKYAACCVCRALAKHEEFISDVTEDMLPTVLRLKDASAKFKEVYVEILTDLISLTNCIPSDLVDSSAIPITTSIIREGPCESQVAALRLLASLTNTDPGVAMVIGTNNLVSMVMCCMKESRCRRVRLYSTEVMKHLTGSRKLGLCKDLMMSLSSYLVPCPEHDSLYSLSNITGNQRSVSPTKPAFDEERRMWNGLEKFLETAQNILCKESEAETDDLGTVNRIHLRPCSDVNPDRLVLISQSMGVLQNLCLWPLDKSRLGFSANKVDLTTFTDDEKQRVRLSKVNRGLTQAIWDKVGFIVTELLASYSDKFSKFSEESGQIGQSLSLDKVFKEVEITLMQSLMELLLCAAVCTCVAFPEIRPKEAESVNKSRPKSPSKLKSSSASQLQHQNQSDHRVENKLSSKSDTGLVDGKLWVRDNPHMSHIGRHTSGTDPVVQKQKSDLRHKEACTDRRLLRKCLYESGVFFCVCPFLKCSNTSVQMIVLQILRCLVHPLEERVLPRPPSYQNCGSSSQRQRPQSAVSSRETEKKLGHALMQMSPDLATLIKDALGPSPPSIAGSIMKSRQAGDTEKGPVVQIPGHPDTLETIHERLQEYAETVSQSNDPTPLQGQVKEKCRKPKIDVTQPIARQCRDVLLEEAGTQLVAAIFSKSHDLKKQSVLLLHDVVQFGELETYMVLSRLGCMSKLLDFLRVNDDDELLEIIGLVIVRILVSSDTRLKQLFNRHGGPSLLLAMSQYTTGLLKQEVAHTLKTVTKGLPKTKRRPCSAPAGRVTEPSVQKPADIWDYIQQRWQREDKVENVLRQWKF